MTRYRAFSLVELLVVLAVVSVLAAALLPIAEQSFELARRNACMNNLRQQHAAMFLYSDDQAGCVPTTPVRWGISVSIDSTDDKFRRDTAAGTITYPGNSTGWYVLWNLDYLTKPILICPCVDNTGDFNGTDVSGRITAFTNNGIGGIHYGYRYNSARAECAAIGGAVPPPLKRNLLADSNRSWRSIATDRAGYAANIANGLPNMKTINGASVKWAHERGGNVITHAGTVRWLENSPGACSPYTWPCTSEGLRYEGAVDTRLK